MNNVIEIHEFSTGIEILGTPENWSIGSFTGNYLNSTLRHVPASVEDAISSGYFKIAEGTSREKPAVVGREIILNLDRWSVVAVVTKGKETAGRTASLYRYFLCEGAGNIGYILQWMNQEKGRIMAFAPFDKQEVGCPHKYQITQKQINLKLQLQNLLSNSPPIIVPFDEPCTPLVLNEMANRLNNPRTWAYNVKGLDKPRNFQVIQSADFESEEIIKQIISKTPKQPQFQGEEKQIITAIKGLMNNNKFNSEYLLTIENELANFDDEKWEYFFNIRGANDAIKNKTHTAQTVRLLTLRAMVLPETLPEFIAWIEKTSNSEHYKISSTFQSEVLNYHHHQRSKLFYLREKLIYGVKFIIPYLVEEPKILDSTAKLLTDERGIWRHYYKNLVMLELDNDFRRISQDYTRQANNASYEVFNHPNWQKIYDHLRNFWQPQTYKSQIIVYEAIAKLFDQLSKVNKTQQELRLLALFQYISQGIISKKLFNKLKKKLDRPQIERGIYINVYGTNLERRVPGSEKFQLATINLIRDLFALIKQLFRSQIAFPLVFTLMILSFILGVLGSEVFKNNFFSLLSRSENPQPKKISPRPNPESEPKPEPKPEKEKSDETPKSSDEEKYLNPSLISDCPAEINIDEDTLTEVYNKKVSETKQAIKDIETQLKSEFPNDKDEIRSAIKEILNPEENFNLQYASVIDSDPPDEGCAKEWSKAIYAYQVKKINNSNIQIADGILTPNGATYSQLIDDIRNHIK